ARFGQGWRGAGAERPGLDLVRDVPPRVGQGSEAARGDRLDQDVADDGRFDRPRQYGPAGRVGGRLVQVTVQAAPADDLDAADLLGRQRLDRAQDGRVAQG